MKEKDPTFASQFTVQTAANGKAVIAVLILAFG
jgi:hypothetical protein